MLGMSKKYSMKSGDINANFMVYSTLSTVQILELANILKLVTIPRLGLIVLLREQLLVITL